MRTVIISDQRNKLPLQDSCMSIFEPYAARVQENEAHRQYSLGSIGILQGLHVENSKKTLNEAHDWLLGKTVDSEN